MSTPIAISQPKATIARLRIPISERKLLLRIGDVLLVVCAIYTSLVAWMTRSGRSFDTNFLQSESPWLAFIVCFWPVALNLADLYDLRKAVRSWYVVRQIVLSGFLLGLTYLAYFFVSAALPVGFDFLPSVIYRDGSFPLRLAPAFAVGGTTLILILWRLLYIKIFGGIRSRRTVVILGAGNAGCEIGEVLKEHSEHYRVLGYIDDAEEKQSKLIGGVAVLGTHSELLDLVARQGVDELVVAISSDLKGSTFQSLTDCYERGVDITPMPLLYEQLTGKVAVEHIGSQWYVALPFATARTSTLYRVIKRLMDIVVGLILLIVFALSLPIIALVIRLDTKGPVFYRQERIGQHGRPFSVLKFRSMFTDAEKNGKAQWATKNDMRITRVGKFIRKTRIDELPQVLNVLRGDMSLVGPRPERQQFIDKLQREIPFYRTRLVAKPGLTGWAQVSYGYGETVEDALIKLQYDLYYIKNQSPWFDLNIMLRTIAVVLRMKGQ